MLQALTLILLCQLLGEAAVLLLGLPLPGPVLGMLLLFAILLARGGPPESVARTADTLLTHLPLLFVPAGVGVMLHWELLRSHWPALLAAVLAGTLLTLAATALTLVGARRLLDRWRRASAGTEAASADVAAPERQGATVSNPPAGKAPEEGQTLDSAARRPPAGQAPEGTTAHLPGSKTHD